MEMHLRDIQAALSTSEQTHRKVERCVWSANAKDAAPQDGAPCQRDICQASRLIRGLSASLYQIHFTLSAADAKDIGTGEESLDLRHVHRCRQILGNLDASMVTAELEGPGGWLLDTRQTERLNRDLGQTLAQLSLALVADTPFALLRAVSQVDILTTASHADTSFHLSFKLGSDQSHDTPTVCGIPSPERPAHWTYTDLCTLKLSRRRSLELAAQTPMRTYWPGRDARKTASPHELPCSYEQDLVRTTLRWLHELRPDELELAQLCEGISIFLSNDAKLPAEMLQISESSFLRIYGASVRVTSDGSIIKLAHPRLREMLPAHRLNTRHQIGVACLRLLNSRDFGHAPKEFRLEQDYADKRNRLHPFYRYSALAWLEVVPGDNVDEALEKEFMDEACRLFSFRNSWNLISWLLEVGRQELHTLYSLSQAQIFICLTTVCKKSSLLPIHLAACFGTARVCTALVESGADVNSPSAIGSPLYCALAGPALLLSDVLPISWDIYQKNIRIDSCLGTAEKLMELGAEPDRLPPRYCKTPSFATMALMASAARAGVGGIILFTSLCSHEQYLADEDFLTLFQDPAFPFEAPKPRRSNLPSKLLQKQFLEDLCALLVDSAWKNNATKIWSAAWEKGIQHGLECILPTTRRQLPLDDDAFAQCMVEAVNCASEPRVRRLIQDSRWDPNIPLADATEGDQGQTLLHRAVEEGKFSMVALLLQYGRADISVFDVSGRTPLHLCEQSDVLRLLVSYGADLGQVDNDGRTLWHYAAANNDINLLQALFELDSAWETVLTQVTKQGRTPLAEALAFVSELNGEPPVPPDEYRLYLEHKTQSIWFILQLIKDNPAYLCSDLPVICYAAEWGIESIVRTFRTECCSLELVATDGSGPLHFLNFFASAGLIREIKAIPGVAELPVLNHSGHTPAEAIFLAFKPSIEECNDNAHPSNFGQLDRSAYEELLTEEVCKSRDHRGRSLWERFCYDIILHYALKKHWPHMGGAISVAVGCFIEKGVIHEYESSSGICALFPLLHCTRGNIQRENMASWFPSLCLELTQATTRVDQLKKNQPGLAALQSTFEMDDMASQEMLADLLHGVSK